MATDIDPDEFVTFWNTYYRDEIEELVQVYPEESTIHVDYMDVFQWDRDVADDWITEPETVSAWFEDTLSNVNTGGIDLENVTVSLVALPDDMVYSPREIRNEHGDGYVAVRGDLSRITTPDDFAETLVFECVNCGTPTDVPQETDTLQEPHECVGCKRQGPFRILESESTFIDYSKIRIETPPEDSGKQGSESIDGFVTGDLVEYGHEEGLMARAGDRATIYGEIERVPKTDGRQKKPLFDRRFNVHAIEFDSEEEHINIAEHKETFERLAERDDAIDLFKQSIAPELFATEAWQAALELGVAYLFGAPRLDIPDGPTYRGDIHALLVTDYGMGKSTFNEGIEEFSPKCINKSATGLSSDVGLLAAAVKDDFGDGQWTIKPGILVRGNGGHVILDEIDKPDADLARMNDALEGQQKIDIEKAGQSATYQSRVGLMATGNPEDSRYSEHEVVAHQIGMDETLLSRFDGIVTMRDTADTQTDAKIAERIIDGIVEASEYADSDRDEFDVLDRPVPLAVGRAWIKYARDEINPVARKEHLIEIKEWYADEIRQLNQSFASEGEGQDMPVPATARIVENTYRFAAAFARLHLRNEIAKADVERAKSLVKQLVSQNWDGEKFTPVAQQAGQSQHERREEIAELIEGTPLAPSEIAAELQMDFDAVRNDLEGMLTNDQVEKLPGGRYEA